MQRRSTKQKELVSAALQQLYHPTAEEVYECLRVTHPTLGRATVFRNLSVLTEEGRLVRIDLPGEPSRYDCTVDGHAHFRCRSCKRILDLPIPLVTLPAAVPCLIEQTQVTYTGLCRECSFAQA